MDKNFYRVVITAEMYRDDSGEWVADITNSHGDEIHTLRDEINPAGLARDVGKTVRDYFVDRIGYMVN